MPFIFDYMVLDVRYNGYERYYKIVISVIMLIYAL